MPTYRSRNSSRYNGYKINRQNSLEKLKINPKNYENSKNYKNQPFTERNLNRNYSQNHKKNFYVNSKGGPQEKKRIFLEYDDYNKENNNNEYFFEDLKNLKKKNFGKNVDFLEIEKNGKNEFFFEDLKILKKENKNLKKENHRLKKIENCWGFENFGKNGFSENESIFKNYQILEKNFFNLQNEIEQKNILITNLEKFINDFENEKKILKEKIFFFEKNLKNEKSVINEKELIYKLEEENKSYKIFFEKEKKLKNENFYFLEKKKNIEILNLKKIIKNLKENLEKKNINKNLKKNFTKKKNCEICEKKEKKLINYSKLLKKYKFLYSEKQNENIHWKKEILNLQNNLQKYKSILNKIEISEKYQNFNKNKKKNFDLEFFKIEIINLNQEKDFLLKKIQKLKFLLKKNRNFTNFEKTKGGPKEISQGGVYKKFENNCFFLEKNDIENLVLKNLLKDFEILRIQKNLNNNGLVKIKDSFDKFFN